MADPGVDDEGVAPDDAGTAWVGIVIGFGLLPKLSATLLSTTARMRKTPKTMLVAQVSTSPVLVPNAVLPPGAAKSAGEPAAAPFLDEHEQNKNDADRDKERHAGEEDVCHDITFLSDPLSRSSGRGLG